MDASVSVRTAETAELDESQSYRHRLATRSLTPGEAGVRSSYPTRSSIVESDNAAL
jgi:hypothetical protein